MDNSYSFERSGLWTFLAGVALGGIVVALTTPRKGARLRKDLRKLASRTKDHAEDWADRASGTLEETGTALNRKAAAFSGQAKDKARDFEDAWKDVKQGVSNAGTDLKDGIHAAGKELHA